MKHKFIVKLDKNPTKEEANDLYDLGITALPVLKDGDTFSVNVDFKVGIDFDPKRMLSRLAIVKRLGYDISPCYKDILNLSKELAEIAAKIKKL